MQFRGRNSEITTLPMELAVPPSLFHQAFIVIHSSYVCFAKKKKHAFFSLPESGFKIQCRSYGLRALSCTLEHFFKYSLCYEILLRDIGHW